MKIGVLAQYLDSRQDIVEVLRRLAVEHEIIVYTRQNDEGKFKKILGAEIQVIQIPDFSGFKKALIILWQYLYLLFGQIPESRYNYYMTERIKLLNPDLKTAQQFITSFLLQMCKVTPDFLTYDHFLNGLLLIKSHLKISAEIDVFLCFTEIYHDWMFAKIIKQNKPLCVYVYSWDHPCKMKTFSKRVNYLVWNPGIKDDLILLQGIDRKKIHVWGATQFAYINGFFASDEIFQHPPAINSPYIYLGCATGYERLARQEIKYCGQIAAQLLEILPQWKLVIRPYPFMKNAGVYDSLSQFSNVILDDVQSNQSNDSRIEKFIKIRDAQVFFHFGTTMGYEAGYFDTPSFLIDFADSKKDKLLDGFVHQYQNDKYLNSGTGSNVIKNKEELSVVLRNISEKKDLYNNEKLKNMMKLQSFEALSKKLLDLIQLH
ncbi:hypothetical protein L0657_19665 [Dyadobacter sp. CY345]|uniref:hypothetical protein n=1 Tax=Dyadobacter sp. CY345 TaxID=2909335 RepID=UPI001F17AEEF|nr:hypothetical protein [Dyadobacter sp. CY345]MCF2446185.1 hypothetical protein [Dyadobacter sp. CY345]